MVYDGVGKDTFEDSLDCLRPRGLMVSFGNASGVVSIPDLTVLSRKGSLYVTRPTGGHYLGRREDLLEGADALFAAIRSGAIKIELDRPFPWQMPPKPTAPSKAARPRGQSFSSLEDKGTAGSFGG